MGGAMELGKLKQVELRSLWTDEAKDFSPWLSSKPGLTLLGETLGMDLELEDTEVYVGNYRADIVAKDTMSNEFIVIENQLSATDHDHIGKLLTYAASFEASTIIWIAQKFRDEHRQAVDWLNEITIREVDFFGIEIELLQIGDSPYAPNLKIVSKPNEWTRSIRTQKQGLTKGATQKLEFWTAFNDYVKSHEKDIQLRKPQPQRWYDVAIGKSGVHISLSSRSTMKDIACEVYMHGEKAKDLYRYLAEDKEIIEDELGEKLEWLELPDGKSSRIIIREPIDTTESENWDDCFLWFTDIIAIFKKAFVPRIMKFQS